MIEALAWTLIALIALTFAGYPLAVLALSRFVPAKPWHRADAAPRGRVGRAATRHPLGHDRVPGPLICPLICPLT